MTKEEFRERVLWEQRLRKKAKQKALGQQRREIERQADAYTIEKFVKLKRRARLRRA